MALGYDYLTPSDFGGDGSLNSDFNYGSNWQAAGAARRKRMANAAAASGLQAGNAMGGTAGVETLSQAATVPDKPSDGPEQPGRDAASMKLSPIFSGVKEGFGLETSQERALHKLSSQQPQSSQEGLKDGSPDRQSGAASFSQGIDRTRSNAVRSQLTELDKSNNTAWGKLGRAVGGSENYHRERAMLLEQLNQEATREDREWAAMHPQVLKEYTSAEGHRMREMFSPSEGRTWSVDMGPQYVKAEHFKAGDTISRPGQEMTTAGGIMPGRYGAPAMNVPQGGGVPTAIEGSAKPEGETTVVDPYGNVKAKLKGKVATLKHPPTAGSPQSQAAKVLSSLDREASNLAQQETALDNGSMRFTDKDAYDAAKASLGQKRQELQGQRQSLRQRLSGGGGGSTAAPVRKQFADAKGNKVWFVLKDGQWAKE